ncbi:uncharacterized protein CIMG_13136 [Coccidioides immitis RS]|uniref:Uncharacterized protein n=1 Tax=Coccidioides immitis (strain RS) TaxID=246410 RepID=J3KA50_COCIM|nr:uncharacterized protein CIMG_13136 [Coccidioides immitis RS]EAS31861.3 hypothetical protein CIMG_13136 [Coccidioides immitis RS]
MGYGTARIGPMNAPIIVPMADPLFYRQCRTEIKVRGNGSYWTSGSLAKCPFAAEYGRIKQGDSRTYPPTGGIWHPAAKLTSAKYEVEPRSSLPEQKLR